GKYLYTAPDKANVSTVAHVSERKLLNFYYNYRQPGILAMHTYYRTDGNAESKVAARTADDGTVLQYLIDQSVITTADFDPSQTELISEYQTASAARKQEILGIVKFKDEFKYKYFERTYETTENGATSTYLTAKRYAARETNFKNYAPIEVKSGLGAVNVPMSFIALPKGAGNDTETGTNSHVTFANAGNTLTGGNELLDSQYTSWTTPDKLALVYKNMTLSDGVNTYPIDNNPYIDVQYVAGPGVTFAAEYKNDVRFKLTSYDGSATPFENANYREDKYGFAISKKTGGKRAPGLLKLTIELKTISTQNEGKKEMVDVEINLLNYAPSVKYWSFVGEDQGQNIEATNSNYVEHRVVMTIGNTGSATDNTNSYISTMTLTSKYNESGTLANATNGDKGVIFYNDPDYEDTMKFYLPSAVQGGLTVAEADHFVSGANPMTVATFYGVATADKVTATEGEGNVNPYTFDPNPNYSTFFDVSPATGSSESLQFIPKAKTQPKFPENMSDAEKQAYYNKYHLKVDSYGVYYPFRVMFYDEYKGSAFTEGNAFAAVIKVYIKNDEVKVNRAAMDTEYFRSSNANLPEAFRSKNVSKYTVNLSTSSTYYVDVTSLLKDDDIVLSGTSYATVNDTAWTNLDAEQKYIRDNLAMPTADSYVDLTRLIYNSASHPVSEDLPFEIYVGGVNYGEGNNYNALPRTTLIFKANCAFKENRQLGYTFADSNGSAVQIVFDCVYSNDAPTANADTFGATNVIDVSMKTGDTFYLYASDSKLFSNDAQSGFTSYNEVGTRYTFPYASGTTLPQLSAKQMSDTFKFFSSRYGSDAYDGNCLILASDDAPTTLRIVGVSVPNDVNGRVTATRE
ncbi:MAG: hypothetical protein K2I75_05920, partial [Clostridiales bacterium]|nr:hypothetical protein [Clostridiales bacterium]